MIKATNFWNCLCLEHDYRCFSGVPCTVLSPLYAKLNSKFLWYLPAVNERVAMSIVSGAWLTGIKGGVLMSSGAIIGLGNEIKAVKDFNIPMLMIVASEDDKIKYPFWHIELTDEFEKDLDKIAKRNKPSVLVVKEGILI